MTRTPWGDEGVVADFMKVRDARPHLGLQIALLRQVLGALPAPPDRVLVLGAGDGFLLAVALETFPEASGVAVDCSPPMLQRARERLAPFGRRAAVVSGDLGSPEWGRRLDGRFGAVVSGFAIHHLGDARKRQLYREVHALLEPGGVFVNVEHVASPSPRVEALYRDAVVAYTRASAHAAGAELSEDDARRRHLDRADHAANILAPVEAQCAWLREAGFVDVDCFWKWFELAVFGGFVPATPRPR